VLHPEAGNAGFEKMGAVGVRDERKGAQVSAVVYLSGPERVFGKGYYQHYLKGGPGDVKKRKSWGRFVVGWGIDRCYMAIAFRVDSAQARSEYFPRDAGFHSGKC